MKNIDQQRAERYVFGYLNERSKVSSQGKLPTISELHSLTLVRIGWLEVAEVEEIVKFLVARGLVFRYGVNGCYYSTRQIEVL